MCHPPPLPRFRVWSPQKPWVPATKALQSFGLTMLEDHIQSCVADAIADGGDQAKGQVAEASQAIARMVRSRAEAAPYGRLSASSSPGVHGSDQPGAAAQPHRSLCLVTVQGIRQCLARLCSLWRGDLAE
ncbi:metal-sensing transcriptional repressor [Streptomyces sp. NPDC059389]|uniref:metal-sensitive transcriptional regulator n=1 Tax=Streptomyces sp. NPDC059389 TaxID=3346818 RepID=UPI0036CE9A01